LIDDGPVHRIRRNPRERLPRRERRQTAVATPSRPVRTMGEVDGYVFVPVEAEAGHPTRPTLEAITVARRVADAEGLGLMAWPLDGRRLDELTPRLAEYGVDRVADLATCGNRDPQALSTSMARLWHDGTVRMLVSADTPLTGEAVRRMVASVGAPVLANVARIDGDGVICLEDGGARERWREPAPILILADGRFPPDLPPEAGEAAIVHFEPPALPDGQIEDLGRLPADSASLPLEEADLILAGGAGVGDWSAYHRLAAALGAAEGGSRVACDAGHLPRDRQVGASGTIVSPRCYLAFGISGAVQHLQGIADCRRVVAVNLDPHAPILGRADLAIVADADAVMQALLEKLESAS
jgi:electron transfer flavoprotein alpha subunit